MTLTTRGRPGLFAPLTLGFALLAAAAQTPQFTDPANLRGERVTPRDDRELPVDSGALGLLQMLRRLNTRASVLNIVAHPDDEDGGMLTFYSRGMGARVADLSLTRGEGGQNAMTGDFGDALGLLRTQELLANDRYTGVDQMFGTEVDFGFSKTKSEAFVKWTHERVLYDAVRAVRLYRPLVITSTWTGGVTDGHGQHQVSGQIAQEVFVKAGDPKVFPEMIAEGILPWQPLKVYARVPQQAITDKGLFDYATGQYVPASFTNYVTGEVSTQPPSADIIVHEGQTDPLLSDDDGKPRSYIQFARIGLGMQKSQIPAGFRPPPAGAFDVPYHRYGSKLAQQPATEQNFFDGIDTSIEGIATLAPGNDRAIKPALAQIATLIEQAPQSFDLAHPEAIAPILAEALKKTDDLIEYITVTSQPFPKDERANVLHELRIKRVQLDAALTLALHRPFPKACTSPVPPPYFFRTSIEQPVYQLTGPELRNAPATPTNSCPANLAPPSSTYRLIGYGDLPRTLYHPPATKHVSRTDLNLATKRRIGYLPGTGDSVPEALASIGLAPTLLSVADLTPAKLANFDTVILGVRTYAAHPELHGAPTQALLDFARSGGNVVVQYQTAEFTAEDAPYPLTLGASAEKVVDETAPVALLDPSLPLLTVPNRITSADFDGWVEERGHGFLRAWDPRYTALTEVHDPGAPEEHILPQEPQRGGLVTVALGKGRWTYLAFAVYRQLPEAVPGAFRLFVDLLQP